MLGKKSDEEMKGEEGLKKKGKQKKRFLLFICLFDSVCFFN